MCSRQKGSAGGSGLGHGELDRFLKAPLFELLFSEDDSIAELVTPFIIECGESMVAALLVKLIKADRDTKKRISSIIEQIGKPALVHLDKFKSEEPLNDTNGRWIDSIIDAIKAEKKTKKR